MFLKKKCSVTLVKDGKVDFIQDLGDRYRYQCHRTLQWGRKVRLSSAYSMGRWEFVAKEQGGHGGQWMETSRGRGIPLN